MQPQIKLLDSYTWYKGQPHQEDAIQWLDSQLSDRDRLEFSRLFRQKPANLSKQSNPPIVQVEFSWTGKYHTSGFRIFQLTLTNNGNVIDKVAVLSGDLSSQRESFIRPEDDWSGSLRCLPEGVYSLGRVEDSKLMRASESWGAGVGRYWIGLEILPQYQANNRSAFGIHADANAAYSPGSAGCICPFDNSGLERILSWMRAQTRPMQLVCDLKTGFLEERGYQKPMAEEIPKAMQNSMPKAMISHETSSTSKELTGQDYQQAATTLGVEEAVIRAVVEVESSGGGFLASGKPKILFEAQWFGKFTGDRFNASHPDISKYQWDPEQYLGGEREWKRFDKAAVLDRNAAIQASSWGLFQILGMHYQICGYSSPEEFYQAAIQSEGKHLQMFIQFIQGNQFDHFLKTKDWAKFAYRYNGEGYRTNRYDTKLEAAYRKYA